MTNEFIASMLRRAAGDGLRDRVQVIYIVWSEASACPSAERLSVRQSHIRACSSAYNPKGYPASQ